MKNIINDKNKIKLIGFLTLLIFFWLIFYLIPEVFVSIFNTILGNLILIIIIILITLNNKVYGLITGLLFILLLRFSQLSNQKTISEAFTPSSEQSFLQIENTINKNKVFDMDIINQQASQKEIDYFNNHGMWPWSQEVISLYEEAVSRNPYIRTLPKDATNYARTIYNQAAIIRILTYQTKEGQFLLNGVLVQDPSGNRFEDLPSGFGDFGYSAGLLGNRSDDIIKCNLKNDNNPTLERITYTGKGGIFGQQTKKVTPVDYNELERIIPGFTFLGSPCNPCKSMAANPDYSCAYRLKVKDKPPFISDVWQYLWNINDNPLMSRPSFLTENINSDEFPLLSELQTELQKQRQTPINN
jgi:hypothetical protein